MCNCKDVEVGSYDNQIWVHAPAHMPKANGYCLDRCIAEEVMQLWMKGITTTGCCCGHNRAPAYIGVIDADIEKMKALEYEVAFNNMYPESENNFKPKSSTLEVEFSDKRKISFGIIGITDSASPGVMAIRRAMKESGVVVIDNLPSTLDILKDISSKMPLIAPPIFPENRNTRRLKRKRYLKD